MGRSSGSACFKIIACGSGDSVDRDDLDAAEGTGADKRGWSFRKKSARHRVLSNTVITETPSSLNKQNPEVTAVRSQAPADSTISEKTSEILWTEEAPRLPTSVPKGATISSLLKETAANDDTLVTREATDGDTLVTDATIEDDSLVTEETTANHTLGIEAAIEDDTLVTEAAIEDDTLVTEEATMDDTLVTESAAIEDDTLVTKEATFDDTLVTETITESGTSIDANLDESAIVIQTAVRKFLVQRALVKHRKVVKLQAAVRGHLVRRHAVGTLRCVQAIVKMQVLVRARHARLSPEGKLASADYDIKLTEMKNSGNKQHPTYVSMDKLLSNSFARQLLESTQSTKQINLKLDPSKSDSAWNWLERWLSASSTEDEQMHKSESNTDFEEQDKVNHPSKSDTQESAVECVSKEVCISQEETSSAVSVSVDPQQPVNTCLSSSNDSDFLPSETKDSDDIEQVELNSLSDKPIFEADEPKRSMKRLAPEQADSDGRKFVFGSRKASSPAFIAAQSKFVELTSTTSSNSSKSFNLSDQDPGVDSCIDAITSSNDNEIKTKVVDLSENSVPQNLKVHEGDSDCETELSISSTLDSPDRSEIEKVEFEKESKVEELIGNLEDNLDTEEKLEQTILGTKLTHSISASPENHGSCTSADDEISTPVSNGNLPHQEYKLADNASNELTNPEDNLDTEEKLEQTILGTELTHSISASPENHGNCTSAENEIAAPVSNGILPHQEYKLADNVSNELTNPEPEMGHELYKSSPESPRSHMTVPESQGTPASQVSTTSKKTRSDKKGPSQKRKSLSASKRSPINASLDSGLRSSMEQLPKDPKSAKKRNSFGSPRPDLLDQEPRDSSSSNSLPSYMQATESARAKVAKALAANGSPRSSPDVHDKETYIKKRHSLPGANDRQGSPRIQRSMSQAQQGTKEKGTNERKWQR